jgi:small-conductance mechanosensitive channel
MLAYKRKRKSKKRKLRGVVADVKTVVALLVMVGLGFAILYMILGAASYTLGIYGEAVNDTVVNQGKEALAQVSSQAMTAVSILVAIPLIIAAVLIIKYIAGSFGFDFGFGGRWYRRALPIPLAP